LPPGTYTVELAFCEHRYTANGARIFDVFINDQLIDPGIDIFFLMTPAKSASDKGALWMKSQVEDIARAL